jgi:hypothetical protein
MLKISIPHHTIQSIIEDTLYYHIKAFCGGDFNTTFLQEDTASTTIEPPLVTPTAANRYADH